MKATRCVCVRFLIQSKLSNLALVKVVYFDDNHGLADVILTQ